jgi:hypothetical protein
MISLKMGGIIVAAFIAGAFISSPDLRAYAANTVFSTDIVDGEVKTADLANNAVTAAKVKDGEIKAAEIATNAVGSSEIATDAVGASELQGVTKLLFGQCAATSAAGTLTLGTGTGAEIRCTISGVDSDDSAIAKQNTGGSCFEVRKVIPQTNLVVISIWNMCSDNAQVGTGAAFSVIVFDK